MDEKQLIINTFLKGTNAKGEIQEMITGLEKMIGWNYFLKPALHSALKHADTGGFVSMYTFNFNGNQTLYPLMGGVPEINKGVAHGDDLMYLFYFGDFGSTNEQLTSDSIISLWTNFASAIDLTDFKPFGRHNFVHVAIGDSSGCSQQACHFRERRFNSEIIRISLKDFHDSYKS